MKLNLNILNVSFFLILIGIFFLPFNSWDGISFLGEYYRDSCVLFFLLAFFTLLFKKKIKLPFHSPIFYSLIIFLVWALLTTLINFETVIDNSFKSDNAVQFMCESLNHLKKKVKNLVYCKGDYIDVITDIVKKNNIVIYESTVFPGCTEEVCVPILEEHSNLIYNNLVII